MLRKLNVLLTGRNREVISATAGMLEGQRPINVVTRIRGNGHSAWPDDVEIDTAILCVDEQWQDSLPGLLEGMPAIRPPLLVLCPVSDVELLRIAMRGGARDVLNPPFEAEELTQRLLELGAENRMVTDRSTARLTVFVNAKGGSGASFLAANTAVAVTRESDDPSVVLVDLNFQFGGLPTYLNMSPGNGLIRALEFADSLDSAALGGYVQAHDSGLHLLAAAPDSLLMPEQISEDRVSRLFATLDESYENILVDIPRVIDSTTSIVIEAADQIVVVTQQSVAHVQDTRRLLGIMRNFLGVSNDRVCIALNRYSTRADVRREDFDDAFPGYEIITVPNDYARVAESINLGVPIIESGARSALSKSILALARLATPPEKTTLKPQRAGVLGWLGRTSKQ